MNAIPAGTRGYGTGGGVLPYPHRIRINFSCCRLAPAITLISVAAAAVWIWEPALGDVNVNVNVLCGVDCFCLSARRR